MSRIEVGPVPSAESSGDYGSSPPATTPTSATILVPYRPVESSVPVEGRTPAGSRRGSANDLSAALGSPDGADIETGLRPAEDSSSNSSESQTLES